MKNQKWLLGRVGAVGLALCATIACGGGSDGASGADGATGSKGADGATGSNGSDGAKGEKGADGAKGADGVKGDSGSNGSNGLDGSAAIFTPVPNGHALQALSTYETGIFDEGASEIVAHHPASQRVFVINAHAGRVQVLDLNQLGQLSDSSEVLDPSSDISGFDVGGVNSVAVGGDIVAVAVENGTKVMAGKVAFYDANTLGFLGAVDAGALPDMVTFSPDGTKVLVANEAEQSRVDEDEPEEFQVLADPAGSITVVDLSAGIAAATATQLDFTAFDARLQEMRAKGIRYIPGTLATGSSAAEPRPLSDDLEPEYIAVSPDGKTAFVTLQENNAVAVVDLSTAIPKVVDLRALGVKDFSRGLPELHNYEIPDSARPSILADVDTSAGPQDLLLGGLSALYFEEESSSDVYSFLTVPDRGPQLDPADLNAAHSGNERPHLMGDSYQATIYRYSFDAADEEFTGMPGEIPLFSNVDGGACEPVRGLANNAILDAGEFAVDLAGNALGFAPLDGDFEGLAVDPDGDGYWLVDEYRPAIYFFSSETSGCVGAEHGLMQYRFVPEGTESAAGEVLSVSAGVLSNTAETLPARYLDRRANRGFEAVAINADDEILYAFIQSPLDYTGARSKDVIRILALDIDEGSGSFGQPVAEYLYFLEGSPVAGLTDKIGDAVFDPATGKILVVERDSSFGAEGSKFLFEIDLSGATNTLNIDDSAARFETLEIDALIAQYGVNPVSKRKVLNFPSIGYVAGDKIEGLALITEGDLAGSLAIMNDNDFGLEPAMVGGKVAFATEYNVPTLGIVSFTQANGLDASDRDDAILIENHPVFGMYMPDSIASYEAGGRTFYVTANEGDSRDFDEARIRGAFAGIIDSGYNSGAKPANETFGRLKFSVFDGDRDYDGDVDDVYAYGARSFSIWDSLGNLVWDSGSDFERITALVLPNDFNSTNDANMSFDDRSDDKGPEPEGVVVGKIGDKSFAFIGLERVGGVMIYDVTEPQSPVFVDYVTSRHFNVSVQYGLAGDLGPEGLAFISAQDSPTGSPLLIVGNEVSGTTTVFHVDL